MRIFNLDNTFSVVCNTKDTRNGFKHVGHLMRGGSEVNETKICYLNRTWERFTYESILYKVVNTFFEKGEIEKYKEVIATFN